MATPTQDWTTEQLLSDAVSKKDILTFLHLNATHDFLVEFKLTGKIPTVVKNAKKDVLVEAYNGLFARQDFRGADEPSEEDLLAQKSASAVVERKEVAVEATVPKFTKSILKKGETAGNPRKGSNVAVFYTGFFEDGTIFDSNVSVKTKKNPLRFRAGNGNVIPGWDDAILTMGRGEKARITIEPEFAYGRKGAPDAKVPIPPNTKLIFEVELASFD
ncbi:FK506-binding protein 2B [Lunasporangiospora selenospora]|uniref:peptidylprolyl isomerase n=1 Tax=Lunasporangiospora selenospora TaxID=979761 RepID=A0A9P6FQT4_9FUNG|nr:FK506-binding protein 2B [Lunasporangiospora selenospora]